MVIIMGTSNCHMVLGDRGAHRARHVRLRRGRHHPRLLRLRGRPVLRGRSLRLVHRELRAGRLRRGSQAPRHHPSTSCWKKRPRSSSPGESGLLALDWWNGNRSVLVDVDLTGLLLGMTLATKPEEIYRALIEATAYGTRMIIETFEANGVPVHEIVATGGLPDRNKLLMQIYADVTGRPINVAGTHQGGALGSAMHGAVAAGKAAGGYDTHRRGRQGHGAPARRPLQAAAQRRGEVYDRLYAEYVTLHDYFGRGGNDVMKRLKPLKADILAGKA